MPMGLLCDSGPAPLAFESHLHLHGLPDVRTTLWKLEADGSGPQLDAVGLACNPLGSLWALYADRSLSYFSEPLASRDACWTLPGAVSDLRSAQGLPGHVLTKVLCLRHKKKLEGFHQFFVDIAGCYKQNIGNIDTPFGHQGSDTLSKLYPAVEQSTSGGSTPGSTK